MARSRTARNLTMNSETMKLYKDLSSKSHDKEAVSHLGRLSDQIVKDLFGIFGLCTVWRRVWIVQELILAKDILIIYGLRTLKWRIVADIAIEHGLRAKYFDPFFDDIGSNCIQSILSVSIKRDSMDNPSAQPDLLKTWASFHQCQSKDSCDMIFGLLNLADDH